MNVTCSPSPSEPSERLDAVQRLVPSAVRLPTDSDDMLLTVVPPLLGALVGIAILVAVGVSLVGQAGGLAVFGAALLGEHSAWYLSRASAFVAYVLLWCPHRRQDAGSVLDAVWRKYRHFHRAPSTSGPRRRRLFSP